MPPEVRDQKSEIVKPQPVADVPMYLAPSEPVDTSERELPKSKSEAIKELIGERPESGGSDARAYMRAKWDQDQKKYSKFKLGELIERVQSTRKMKGDWAKDESKSRELHPIIDKIANEAGTGYMRAINEHLASHGVGAVPKASRSEMVATAALKLAGHLRQ
jgi:hypothetical protein